MAPKPTVHPLALQHLRELRERWGVEPTLEESIWIVSLCERVLCPCEGERSDLCGIPIRAGVSDVFLWPFTIGASVWYQDYAAKWWGAEVDRMNTALCYALANARDKDAIRSVALSKESAEKTIKAWALSLNCTPQELCQAFDEAIPPVTPSDDRKGKDTPKKIDWESIVGEIEATTGIPADHWLWDVSKDATLRAWHRARSVLIARAGGSSSGSVLDPLNVALQDLADAKTAIIKAHKEAQA